MHEKENPIQEGGRGNPRMAGGQQLHSNSEWRGNEQCMQGKNTGTSRLPDRLEDVKKLFE